MAGEVADKDMQKLEYALNACKDDDPFLQKVALHDTVVQVVCLAFESVLPPVPLGVSGDRLDSREVARRNYRSERGDDFEAGGSRQCNAAVGPTAEVDGRR